MSEKKLADRLREAIHLSIRDLDCLTRRSHHHDERQIVDIGVG